MFFSKKQVTFIENLNSHNTKESLISSAYLLYSLNSLESCAYVNLDATKNSFISLLEQLFLRTNLKKEYPYIHIDYYLKFNSNFLIKGILSQAEFQNLKIEKLVQNLIYYRYDTIILDNLDVTSQHLDTILTILNSSEITSNIVIIGSDKIKFFFEKKKIEFHSSLKLELHSNLKDSQSLYSSSPSLDVQYSNQPNILNILTNPNISSWLSITYNLISIKKSGTKRFFFISNSYSYSKEITFILIMKKCLKQIPEFENWDYMVINPNNLNFILDMEYNKQLTLLNQSLLVEGFSNLIFNTTLDIEKFVLHKLTNLNTLETVNNTNNSFVIISSLSQINKSSIVKLN
ncbi:MAG: hypothetical protein LAT82_01715 [Nanoarchaeota archaeon]|nr:hypothetical protein [Nanoarchaeota archaeon]